MRKNSLKKTILAKFIIVLTLFIFSLTSCSWNEEKSDKWTVLIYMAADNSLSSNADEDISEMMLAEIPNDINVIVQIDRNIFSDDPEAKRYKITHNSLHLLQDLGEIDSGDYNQLTDFVNWGTNKYPSEKTAIIIWSHGNGWLPGYNKFCPDNQADNYINIPDNELNLAISNMTIGPDILAFDSCNMLSIEVISEVAEHAEYVLGSERSIPADGFPYDEILPVFWEYNQTEVICDQIIYKYVNSHMPSGSQNPHNDNRAMSGAVVDCSNYGELEAHLKTFCGNWINTQEFETFILARDNIEVEFNDLSADIDIKDYFKRLRQSSSNDSLDAICNTILADIDSCFISQYFHDTEHPYYSDNAGTASIWFPDNPDTFSNLITLYSELNFAESTNWNNFISQFFWVDKK